jgi:hypothetical protein
MTMSVSMVLVSFERGFFMDVGVTGCLTGHQWSRAVDPPNGMT